MTAMLEQLAIDLVCAGYEASRRQQELVPLLARTLGVKSHEVFYQWVLKRNPQVGMIEGTMWRFFFHGNDCWLTHQLDGRHLDISFGPGGRYDIVGDGMSYALTVRPPWRTFPELQAYLAKEGPPYHKYAGNYERAAELDGYFRDQGLFEFADPALAMIEEQHTVVDERGSHVVRLPKGYADPTTPLFWDVMVCKNPIFSAKGLAFVREHYGARSEI